ncbi:MAG: ribose-phosphate pyrophosphokinase [Candidatus Omnitrophica bacterium]|nr:ribose-phosphate pyrophosphokinase [Candidatus Omnitrophota bacterium]MDD5671111.1 ribose-phosphate pyrophosphokinase [Candidatus Omnitrophota bacterium]
MFGFSSKEGNKSLVVLGGNSNPELVSEIAKHLNVPVADVLVDRFPEGEVRVQIHDNIRGKDVFIVQSTCTPPNENLMELLILIDAARRASAARVTAVLPFFGYARQDRKDKPRVPITAKLIANLITQAGANRVLTMDLHAGQIQGFFDIPVDHLYSINVIGDVVNQRAPRNLVVVSPDVGGIKMARGYAKLLNVQLAIVDKRREDASQTHVMHIIGSVEGKNVVIIDDMVSTAGSLIEAVKALKGAGALDIYAAVVHPILCGPAIERIKNSELKELIVTNSIPILPEKRLPKIIQISVGSLLAEAIKRIHQDESISSLFSKAGVEA